MNNNNTLKFTSLNLFGSILLFTFQILLASKMAPDIFGNYRLFLAFLPLICILLNPGLDIIILTGKHSTKDFFYLAISKIFLFLILLIIIIFIFNCLDYYFLFSIPTGPILALGLGGLIGQIPSCLRNYIYANGYSKNCAVIYEYSRIAGIIFLLISINFIPLNIPILLLLTSMFSASGGPFSIVTLIILFKKCNFSSFNKEQNLTKNNEMLRGYFKEIKKGALLSISSTSLYGIDIFYKFLSSQLLGPSQFGFLSLILMPFNEFQRIGRLLSTAKASTLISFHEKVFILNSFNQKIIFIKSKVLKIFSYLNKNNFKNNFFIFLFISLPMIIFYLGVLNQKYDLEPSLFIFWLFLSFIKPLDVYARNIGSFIYYSEYEYRLIIIRVIISFIYGILIISGFYKLFDALTIAYIFFLISELSSILLYLNFKKIS